MPLFAALNLYDDAITKIAIYADLALEDPACQETAIWLIHDLCHRTDESVENIISGAFPKKE